MAGALAYGEVWQRPHASWARDRLEFYFQYSVKVQHVAVCDAFRGRVTISTMCAMNVPKEREPVQTMLTGTARGRPCR